MTLAESLGKLDELDFRVKGRCRYRASEIALVTLCALVAGGTSHYDFADYGREKADWLRGLHRQNPRLPDFRNGTPSHDAFRYFWKNLPPAMLDACFMEWIDWKSSPGAADEVHVDGKVIRRANAPDGSRPCVVSAYSSRDRIVVGQVKTSGKSNEIAAMPRLLGKLRLAGAVVTIDAAGCQRKVVEAIAERGADYLIALKGNQGGMLEAAEDMFRDNGALGWHPRLDGKFDFARVAEKGHGRITVWECLHTDDIDGWFDGKGEWAGLKSVCMVTTRTEDTKTGETTESTRYFISSLPADAKRALGISRRHWDVENPLHWTLDMVFDEDHSRARAGFSAENLAIMRHFCLDMIRRDKGTEGGMSRRKKAMTWNDGKMREAILAA